MSNDKCPHSNIATAVFKANFIRASDLGILLSFVIRHKSLTGCFRS